MFEIFSTLSSSFIAIRKVEHDMEWWPTTTAISVLTMLIKFQSSPQFLKLRRPTKVMAQFTCYSIIFTLFIVQFGPYLQAFFNPLVHSLFDFIGGLF